jgi:hypothetical protein
MTGATNDGSPAKRQGILVPRRFQWNRGFTPALIPALSPGRGGIVRRFLAIPKDAVVVRLHAISTEAGMATGAKQLSSDMLMLTLFPGERVGVRAGVITNFMPASEESFSNLLFR